MVLYGILRYYTKKKFDLALKSAPHSQQLLLFLRVFIFSSVATPLRSFLCGMDFPQNFFFWGKGRSLALVALFDDNCCCRSLYKVYVLIIDIRSSFSFSISAVLDEILRFLVLLEVFLGHISVKTAPIPNLTRDLISVSQNIHLIYGPSTSVIIRKQNYV